MNKYETYDNFDPVWLVDFTEYPQKKQTFRYSESTMKRYSDYYYNDCKAGISLKPYEDDYLFIINSIERDGFIKGYYGKSLFGQLYNGARNESKATFYDEEYERVKSIQAMWDF